MSSDTDHALGDEWFGSGIETFVLEFDGPLEVERELELFGGVAGVFGIAVEVGPVGGGSGEGEKEKEEDGLVIGNRKLKI